MIKPEITLEDFQKLDIRLGLIRFVEPVPNSDKLLRCLVDFGEELKTEDFLDENGQVFPVRQIVSGIRGYYPDFENLIGMTVLYVVNLETRKIKGIESHGMLMATGDNDCVFLIPSKKIAPGSSIH